MFLFDFARGFWQSQINPLPQDNFLARFYGIFNFFLLLIAPRLGDE